MITRRAALAGLAALPAVEAAAQQRLFPTRPPVMIVPFPAGGPADIFGRFLAEGMATGLGRPVAVQNKSGAAGVTGLDFVAKSGPDAHVMGLMSASAGAIVPALMPNMPYDTDRDLAPVILVVRVQEVLVVNAKLGIGDLAGLLVRLRAGPGKLSYGSAGTGSITHLAMELFKRETHTEAVHVPYRGAAPATRDLIKGLVQMAILDIPVVLPHVRSGVLKAIAISSDLRAPLLPGVPTMFELGYPKVNSDNWYGLVSPGNSIRADRMKIHGAAARALGSQRLAEAYAAVGGIVGGGSSEDFGRFRRKEARKWAEVIKRANIQFA
jgi:tripartite-type tricarboxylate transporter receptor subunit TctC